MTDRVAAADQIWRYVYDTFENHNGDAWRTGAGAKSQVNDVQFRLMKSIAELKNPQADLQVVISAVEADTNVATALSWMSEEVHDKILDILHSIEVKGSE